MVVYQSFAKARSLSFCMEARRGGSPAASHNNDVGIETYCIRAIGEEVEDEAEKKTNGRRKE